jgi:hypothetical protein
VLQFTTHWILIAETSFAYIGIQDVTHMSVKSISRINGIVSKTTIASTNNCQSQLFCRSKDFEMKKCLSVMVSSMSVVELSELISHMQRNAFILLIMNYICT